MHCLANSAIKGKQDDKGEFWLELGPDCGTIGTIGNQWQSVTSPCRCFRMRILTEPWGHPCSTIQGSVRYLSLMWPAVVLWPRWTNNHYPLPGLIAVINLYKLAPPSHPSIDKAFSRQSVTITIGCSDNRDRVIGQALVLVTHPYAQAKKVKSPILHTHGCCLRE